MLPEHDWQQRDFANGAGFDKPVGSGPYRIGQIDNGRSITFERDPTWWAVTCRPAVAATISPNCASSTSATPRWRARCSRAGLRLQPRVLRNRLHPGLQRRHTGRRSPATAHLGPAKPQVAQGFVFNLDRPQFKDRRVRQALGMLWDFEWSNRQMMRNLYIRQQSVFSIHRWPPASYPMPAS